MNTRELKIGGLKTGELRIRELRTAEWSTAELRTESRRRRTDSQGVEVEFERETPAQEEVGKRETLKGTHPMKYQDGTA